MQRKKKTLQEMSSDELIELATQHMERRQQRNTRRRERRHWLKTAPREETALRYRAQEKPCAVAQYLKAERFLLRWLDEFPDLKGDATAILLVLAHNVLHILYPKDRCEGDTLADCPTFSIHEICSAAIDIGFNYRLDPAFGVSFFQAALAMMELSQGVDRERLLFNSILADLSLDL